MKVSERLITAAVACMTALLLYESSARALPSGNTPAGQPNALARPGSPVENPAQVEGGGHPCDVGAFEDPLPGATCRTPRNGSLSGGYLALDAGIVTPSSQMGDRVGIGLGGALQVRVGFELWDTVLLGLGIGGIFPHDRRPFSQAVVDCDTVGGQVVSCDDEPHSAESTVSASLFTMETGVQRRFRPWDSTSWTPGLTLGYGASLYGLHRRVSCDGCPSFGLDAKVSGAYVAPFFRVTFGELGMWAAVLRSNWFLTGELQQMSTLGVEFGFP